MSFKCGDKVKLVKVDHRYSSNVGDEGVVVAVYSDTLQVECNGYDGYRWHKEYTKKIGENEVSNTVKYYRNLKDNFLWDAGAVLSDDIDADGYKAVSDLWDKTEHNEGEYISRRIVEAEENKDMFERVYPIGKLEKMVFGNRKAARAAMEAGAYKAKASKK